MLEVLSNTTCTAGESGWSVSLKKSVANYKYIIVFSNVGVLLFSTELNKQLNSLTSQQSGDPTMWWYEQGLKGTFYNYTIYLIVGIK